ncbi:MAG: AAA family ATPase [Candidatus Sulfotelmatobacter sp.]
MRKWMRERLQRRKKTPLEPSDQPAPPPLQPAYFDAEQAPSTPPHAETQSEISAEPPPAQNVRPARRSPSISGEQSSQEPSTEAPAAQESAAVRTPNTGRGRRRRGGRGGRGREQAVAQAFTPAAVKGSVPGVPAEPAEEEFADARDAEEPIATPSVAAAPRIPSAPAAPQRPPKGVVVLAIGLPGSGKSSWFKRHNVVPLSSDMVRSLLFDDVREQRFQDLVFSNLRSMLKARLIAKRPMNYVDATNLTPQERQHWIKLAKDYQYEVHAVFFDVPLEVCLERHQRRDRVVPEDVMRRMAAKLKPPAFEEGFAKITVVRVKKKESES